MRAFRVLGAWLFVASAGCDGPVLKTGVHLLAEDSGEASDARVRDSGAGRARDAQTDADAHFPWDPEPRRCNRPQQCYDNEPNIFCSPAWGICVECLRNEDCQGRRCNEETGQCRDWDKPRP